MVEAPLSSVTSVPPAPHGPHAQDFEIISVPTMLERSIAQHAALPCIDFLDRVYTYRQIGDLVNRAAKGLQAEGLKKGDRVGLCLPNSPFSVILFFAILKAGGIVVNFNPLYVEREIQYQIDDAGVRFMATLDLTATYPRVGAMLAKSSLEKVIVCQMADSLPFPKNYLFPWVKAKEIAPWPRDNRHINFRDLINHGNDPTPVPCDPQRDVAVLQYTGGTTGVPKGAMLSHANLTTNAQQCYRWFPRDPSGAQERLLAVLPFFHVFALSVAEMVAIIGGFFIILLPRFDVVQVLETIQKKKPTTFPGVPTIYTAINTFKDTRKYDLSSIRYCLSGGAPLPLEVKTEFERLTGSRLSEGYGLTETSPVVTTNPIHGLAKPGSIGIPVEGTVVEIVSIDNPDQIMPTGERGEVCVRGPQVMLGYWNRPDETEKVLKNGLLRTGDVGYVDEDGYVYLVDRIKDLIIAGGFNIYPRNIEEAIYKHPDIAETVVIGIPDPYRGQTVKAYVVRRHGGTIDEAGLKSFLKEYLSPIEMPKIIEFRESLPKTQVGKLSKKMLMDEEAAKTTAH